jgi:hypothetical protein
MIVGRQEGGVSMPAPTFQQVAEMASQLPVEEQLRLAEEIRQRIEQSPVEGEALSDAQAILRAISGPPHLDPADVDELERSIADGRRLMRQERVLQHGGNA